MSTGPSAGNLQGSSGLGQSTPLVTITGPFSSISRGIAVPAGDNHPLASASLSAPASATVPVTPEASVPRAPTSFVHGTQVNHQVPIAPSPASANQVVPHVRSSGLPLGSPAPISTPAKPKISSAKVSPGKTLDALADAFLSESSHRTDQLGLAPLLRPLPLPREDGIDRLRTLVERRAWGDVLKISTSMLNAPKSLHADVYASLVTLPLNAPQVDISSVRLQVRQETVEIMTLQCHALLKLRRYSDIATEVERWNFLTQNDATAESPDWLPWSLHILAGQVQQYMDDSDRSSDVLFELRDRIPQEDAIWLVSVDNALANVFLRQGRWRLALGSYDRMLALISQATKADVRLRYPGASNQVELESYLTVAYKCEILSRQGRTLLQVGALPQVALVFESAKTLWDGISSTVPAKLAGHRSVAVIPCLIAINEALFYFAKGNFERSLGSFTQAVEIFRKCGIFSKYAVEDWMGPTVAGSEPPNVLYSECINNMALCCLYTCRMRDAVELLEDLIRQDPTSFLTERVAFNLCTLYELGADNAVSARRKRVLQLIAKRFFLHDVGPESFRVT